MEGEKETSEEKEEDEEHHHHIAAASSLDYRDLPIMHWEDLSRRITELEEQEQERSERAKREVELRMGESQGGVWRDVWEEEEEDIRCRVSVITSRFHHHRKLQLCFINNSDSEDEQEGGESEDSEGKSLNGCHASGLKQEVVTALRTLRDKLLAEQKENKLAGSSSVVQRNHLERWDLQESSVQQLGGLRSSLQQDVHALSSELVALLLVRDQLRTKQDAMLMDVQDLT